MTYPIYQLNLQEKEIIDKYNLWYNENEDWFLFMNYGYKDDQENNYIPTASDDSRLQIWKNQINLYIKSLEIAKITSKSNHGNLVELSCGRGGGLLFLKKYFKFKSVIGIDINLNHLYHCEIKGVEKKFGSFRSLGNLQVAPDIILSVEAFNYYNPFETYLQECYKVLKPGGTLIQTGIGDNKKHLFEDKGFFVEKEIDITNQVLESAKECEIKFSNHAISKIFKNAVRELQNKKYSILVARKLVN